MTSRTKYLYFLLLIISRTNGQCNNDLDQSATDTQPPAEQRTESQVLKEDWELVKLVEERLLDFMGVKERPDPSLKSKVKVPNEMWKLYCKWSDQNHHDPLKNDVDSVRLVEQQGGEIGEDAAIYFNLTSVKRSNVLRKAELLLFTERMRRKPLRGAKFMRVFDGNNSSGTNQTLISVLKVPRNKEGYVRVDLTRALANWMSNNDNNSFYYNRNNNENIKDNRTIITNNSNSDNSSNSSDDSNRSINNNKLRNRDSRNSPFSVRAEQNGNERTSRIHVRRRRSQTESDWMDRKPLLFLYMSTTTKQSLTKKKKKKSNRKRRSTDENDGEETSKNLKLAHAHAQKETCGLRGYYLDFVKRQWDLWIIAPRGYNLNYCHGECPNPLGRHYNVTNHAVIHNQLLRLKEKQHDIPKLCCVPTDLRDQTFLYMDSSGELSLKNPTEMSAVGCGCR